MSNTVDQKIVKMLFDNAQFEQGINQSIKSIDNLKQSLKFDNIGGASLDSLSGNLNGLSSSVDSISDKFSTMGIMSTTWIAKIANAIGDLAGNAIRNLTENMTAGYNRYNEMMESVQTIMYATRNQWDDTEAQMDYVTAQIDKLNWYTDETSYNLSDMTNSIGKFVAAGVSLDDAATAMEGISSWAAISGQNAEKASYAMYNLAQAMAIGKVTTADWKSIENANMATEEFKETVINTAVNLGYLEQYCTDEGEWFTYYAKQTSKGLEEIQVTTENMRTTLQYGWFNSEVLTETLRQYGEFADQLYYAVESTGVSTTEFLGYLDEYQEAVANGVDTNEFVRKLASRENIENVSALGQYLELLSGDFYELGRASFKAAQESKTFKDTMDYTADAITTTWMNIFQDIFGNYLESKELWTAMSELMYEQMVAPLEEIEEQLSLWNEKGGADVLKDAFWDIYDAVSAVQKAIKEGFAEVFPDNLGLNLLRFVRRLSYVTEEFKLRDDLFEFEKLKIAATNFAKFFENILSNFERIGAAIKKAWNKIFPEKEVNRGADSIINKIRDFSYWLEELSEKFLLTWEDGDKLERTFEGLFAILDIGRMLLVAIIEPFTKIDGELQDVNYGFLDITASIGDWLVALRDFIRDNEIFQKAISWILEQIPKIPGYLDQLSRKFLGMGLNELFEKVAETATTVFMVLAGLFVDFDGTVKKVDEVLTNSVFGTYWIKLKDYVTFAWSVIKGFFDYVIEKKGDITTDVLAFFTDSWGKIKEFFGKVKEKVTGIWEIVSGSITTAWNKIKDFFTFASEKISSMWKNTSDGGKSIVSRIADFFKELKEDPGAVWSSIKEKAKEAFNFIGNLFSTIGSKISEKFEGTPIGNFFEKLGENIRNIWNDIPEKASEAWNKLKEFFGLIGTTAGDIWDSIPGYIENAWTNITGFVDGVKTKASELWTKIEPYVSKIAEGFKAAGNKIKDNWDTIWPNIVRFFEFLIEKGGQAIDWIISIDWAAWWENIKTWAEDTWTSVKDFFDNLPDKAKESFEKLTGTDWNTFLDDMADKWDLFKQKVGEAWDAIKQFFEDLPGKMDELAGSFGYNSWAEAWADWTKSISDAYHALKLFFELERPEWMTQNENGEWIPISKEELSQFEGFDSTKGLDGILTYRDILESINDFKPIFDDFFEVSPQFIASINMLVIILTLLAKAYMTWQTFKEAKGLVEQISEMNLNPFKTEIGTFTESIGDSVENMSKAADKMAKGASWALMGATILEIAVALRMVGSMDPLDLAKGIAVLGVAFVGLFKVFDYYDKNKIDGSKMKEISESFALMGVVFIELAAALWVIQNIPLGQLASSVGALALLFSGIVAAFVVMTKFNVEPSTALDFAVAVDVMSISILAIALALMFLQNIEWYQLLAGAASLTIVLGGLVAAMVVLTKSGVDAGEAMIFAGAIDLMALSIVALGYALAQMKDLDPIQMLAAALALSILLGGLTAVLIIADKFTVSTGSGLLAIGAAIALIGIGAMAAGIGLKNVAESISIIASIGEEGVNVILYGIMAFVTLLPSMTESVVASLRIFVEAAGGLMVAFFVGLANAINNNRDALVDGMTNLFTMFIDVFNNVIPALIEAIGNFIQQFFGMLVDSWPQIEEFLLMAGETVLQLLEQLITGLLNILDVNMPVILSILEQLSIGLMNIITKLIPLILEQTRLILDGLLDITVEYTPKISDAAFKLILDTLQHILDNIGEITAIATAIAIEIALGFIDGLSREIDDIIDTGIDFVINFINGIADGIRDHAEDMKNALTNLRDAAVEGARTLLGINNGGDGEGSPFWNIASDMILSFINGIRNGISNVCSAVRDVIQAAINTAEGKDGLDENSPSKVMEQIGAYGSEGLADGFKNSAKSVIDASAEVANEAVDTVTDSFAKIGDNISKILEDAEFPTITPVLDLSQLTEGASEIGGLFNNMPTLDLAGAAGLDFNFGSSTNPTSQLTDAVNKLTAGIQNGDIDSTSIQNTFNITGEDPKAIANEVSTILQNQVDRRNAVWA